MTEQTTRASEREEIEMLVPFYVTGRISAEDARRVDAYLKRNPDFAEHIELARDERAATASVNEALGFPSARSADKIFEAIAADNPPTVARARARSRGLLMAIREFFVTPTPGAVRFVAAAAAAVFLVQAIVLGSMLMRPDAPGGYQTAAGPQQAATPGIVALVAFHDTATLADISRTLTTADATIVEGPLNGGLFKVRIVYGSDGEAGANRRLNALKAETSVVKTLLPSR